MSSLSRRRIGGILRKELRDYSHNRGLIWSMGVIPLVFIIQPLVVVLGLTESASREIGREHVLLYLLGIPILVPVIVAAYAIAGERAQGTLEPALTTPIRGEEFLLGKALAALVPSIAVAFVVYVLFLVLVGLFAQPGIAGALLQGPDLLAQLAFTPLLALWSIWVGMAVSARSSDLRVAQQLALVASLPPVFIVVLTAVGIIAPTLALAIGAAVLLVILDGLGWRLAARLFDRERLITG